MSAKAVQNAAGSKPVPGKISFLKQAVNFWSDLKAGAVDTF
jgi:hypothetical protein